MTSMVWLRILAIASLLIGITYNAIIAMHESQELWTVVEWQVVFLAINITQSVRLVVAATEIRLAEGDKQLASATFPLMRSRDFRSLLAAGTRRTITPGEKLLDVGDETDALAIVATGDLILTNGNGTSSALYRGQMFGDISLAVGEQYGGSPVRIVAGTSCEVIEIPYSAVKKLRDRNPQFAYALTDGILRGMAKKARLLLPLNGVHASEEFDDEVALSERERLVHARAMPQMKTADVHALFELGTIEAYQDATTISNADRVGIVCNGTVTVLRQDEQQIVLGPGAFVGEIAWVARRDLKIPSTMLASDGTEVLWLDFSVLSRLRLANPLLMARLTEAVARNMAIKLTWPLSGGRVGTYDFSSNVPPQLVC